MKAKLSHSSRYTTDTYHFRLFQHLNKYTTNTANLYSCVKPVQNAYVNMAVQACTANERDLLATRLASLDDFSINVPSDVYYQDLTEIIGCGAIGYSMDIFESSIFKFNVVVFLVGKDQTLR
jgi:hypothetical protein